jgi:D-alanyl-D-alanine carboxypeptidase (penicillin-binding protein 5/6)
MVKASPSLRRMRIVLLLLLATPLCAAPPPGSESFAPDRLAGARAAVLEDAASGKILFAYHPDLPLAPASLTKLVTLHLTYRQIAAGALGAGQLVAVPPEASWRSQEAGSSLMFLEPGQRVTVSELMQGLAVSSGNDAASALACAVAGNIPSFVELMNREMRRLGHNALRFVDPSGLSAANTVTARDFAAFCRDYIRLHPDSLADLHARRSLTYPLPANLPAGPTADPPAGAGPAASAWPDPGAPPIPIRQNNRNLLLWEYPGLDGLKTGYIEEAGYNIAATARRGDMRLIAVVLGVPAPDHARGGGRRRRRPAGLRLRRLRHPAPRPAPPGCGAGLEGPAAHGGSGAGPGAGAHRAPGPAEGSPNLRDPPGGPFDRPRPDGPEGR